MSSQTTSKKRKSADDSSKDSKKARVVKSADRPAPVKSALKKADGAVSTSAKPVAKKSRAPKASKTKSEKKDTANVENGTVEEDQDVGGVDLTPDQTAALLAGFSSSDEDEEETGMAISSIPKAPTTGLIQKRINQAIAEQDDPETTPGVIYVGRVPHGFYEPQMKAYLSQFGEITNLRLGRNKKTGKSQHHAFVEFASAAVADIVVKTMDKYLLFGHLLQVRRLPKDQIKENIFRASGGRRNKKPAPRNKLETTKLKRGATRDVWEKRVEQENKRRVAKAEKLKEMGYEFDVPVLKVVADVPVKPKADIVEVAAIDANGDQQAAIIGEPTAEIITEPPMEVQQAPEADVATKKAVSKKRALSGKTQTKKAVKKAKV